MCQREKRLLLDSLRVDMSPEHIEDLKCRYSQPNDWGAFFGMAARHRVLPIIHRTINEMGLTHTLPQHISAGLKESYLQNYYRNHQFSQEVAEILRGVKRENLPLIVMRGIGLAEHIYGNIALRYFSDIDVLIHTKDLERAKRLFQEIEFESPGELLDDRYYERNHLHLQYIKEAKYVSAEIHWALDHRYTLYDINVNEIFEDAKMGTVVDEPALVMSSEDLLIILCIHVIKHGYYIKYIHDEEWLVDRVLEDDWLTQFLDVFFTCHRLADQIDWDRVAHRAKAWRVERAVYCALSSINTVFGPSAPPAVLEKMRVLPVRPMERRIAALIFKPDPESARRGILGRLLRYRKRMFFNPIRLLDLFEFFLPRKDYIFRRYGARTNISRLLYGLLHLAGSVRLAALGVLDLIYYFFKKQLSRLFRLGRNAQTRPGKL